MKGRRFLKEISWERIFLIHLSIVFFVLIVSPEGVAQAEKKSKNKGVKVLGINLDTLLQSPIKEIDTNYIKHYYKYLHIHPVLENRNYTLFVYGNNKVISYKPNVTSSVGAGLTYKWFSFDFTFKIPFTDKALGRKGKTNQLGLGFSYTGRKIWFNTYYESAKGLYLANPQEFDINWFINNSSYPIRKDLLVRTLYTRGYYNFNYRKFSNPAPSSYQERQKKSAGSFLLGGSFVAFELRADSSLIPLYDEGYVFDKNKVKYNAYGLTLNPGYVYTFVFNRIFFASVSFRPGVAFKFSKSFSKPDDNDPYQLRMGWQGDGIATLGFNNDNFYGGISYASLVFSDNLKDTGIFSSYSYLRILVGRRFKFKPRGMLKEVPGFN